MNSITEQTIFDYMEIEILGDLERLKLALENIDDKKLCELLEKDRGNGRDDFPVRVMLNLIYSMKVFGHRSVDSFRRELSRNSSLRKACGLKDEDYLYLGKRKSLVPPSRVFTGFFKNLIKYQNELDTIFDRDVEWMYENIDNFGKDCAYDGKIINSYAKRDHKEKKNDTRAEHDATWTCKTYDFADGTKKKNWYFGFREHIICDATYGLPIYRKLETAKVSEQKVLDDMIDELRENKKQVLKTMDNLMADAGLDNGDRNKLLKETYDINPIVDIRLMWTKREKLREIENKPLAYSESGEVYYIKDIVKGEYEKLMYLGYDKQRKSLRYGHIADTGVYRIPLKTDYRIFTPVARDSEKFKKLYNKRTEVERLNGRLDRDYMFNDHFIRGKKKLNMMLSLSYIIMMAMARGHIKNKEENIRSLVKT